MTEELLRAAGHSAARKAALEQALARGYLVTDQKGRRDLALSLAWWRHCQRQRRPCVLVRLKRVRAFVELIAAPGRPLSAPGVAKLWRVLAGASVFPGKLLAAFPDGASACVGREDAEILAITLLDLAEEYGEAVPEGVTRSAFTDDGIMAPPRPRERAH